MTLLGWFRLFDNSMTIFYSKWKKKVFSPLRSPVLTRACINSERLGKGVILEDNFSDMYSNINETFLNQHVGAELAGLHSDLI